MKCCPFIFDKKIKMIAQCFFLLLSFSHMNGWIIKFYYFTANTFINF